MNDGVAEALRASERERLTALVERNMDVADALHADDYGLITPGGAVLSKHGYLSGIASGALRYRRFEPDGEMAVRVWGPAAALRYQVRIEMDWEGGRDSGRFWHTDIYELRDGRWQVVWSQATRIPASEALSTGAAEDAEQAGVT